MKILEVKEEKVYYVETDEHEFSLYRTDGKGNWECNMGDSWEPRYFKGKELEELFAKYMGAPIEMVKFEEWLKEEYPLFMMLPAQMEHAKRYFENNNVRPFNSPVASGRTAIQTLLNEYEERKKKKA